MNCSFFTFNLYLLFDDCMYCTPSVGSFFSQLCLGVHRHKILHVCDFASSCLWSYQWKALYVWKCWYSEYGQTVVDRNQQTSVVTSWSGHTTAWVPRLDTSSVIPKNSSAARDAPIIATAYAGSDKNQSMESAVYVPKGLDKLQRMHVNCWQYLRLILTQQIICDVRSLAKQLHC